jgi:hypothetical protein
VSDTQSDTHPRPVRHPARGPDTLDGVACQVLSVLSDTLPGDRTPWTVACLVLSTLSDTQSDTHPRPVRHPARGPDTLDGVACQVLSTLSDTLPIGPDTLDGGLSGAVHPVRHPARGPDTLLIEVVCGWCASGVPLVCMTSGSALLDP